MSSTIRKHLQFPAVLILMSALLAPMASARDVDRTKGISMKVYEKIQEIQELADNNDLDGAEKRLRNLLDGKLSDYERAQGLFLLGYLSYQKKDPQAALQAYEQVIQTEGISLGMRVNVARTLSQLYMVEEQYKEALRYANELINIEPEPAAVSRVLKAQILYNMERIEEALAELDAGIELNASKGHQVREDWLLLKNALLYSRNDYNGMLAILQQLVDLYPRDRYLLNMAAIYGELGDSKKQLSLMEPLYERGALGRAAQLSNLASLYMLHNIPYKAATLLEKELRAENIEANGRNLELLAQAWLLAAKPEKAIAPMSQAAPLGDNGRVYVDLARIYLSLQLWKEAEQALQQGMDKGGLRNMGDARLMLGMAQFNQKNFRAARRSFSAAGREAKTENLARQWLVYLEREEEQLELAREVADWM